MRERTGRTGDGAGAGPNSWRERTRRRVLEGAFELIGREHGLSVRIEEICALVQVSRGTFYNYFSGMDDLFAALSFDISHDFNKAVWQTVARMPTMTERVSGAMRYYFDRALHDPKWAWAMVNISAVGPLFGAETFAGALADIENGIASGEFAIADARLGRDMVLGTSLATMITLLREGLSEAQIQQAARYVLRGLGVPGDRADEAVSRKLPPPTLD